MKELQEALSRIADPTMEETVRDSAPWRERMQSGQPRPPGLARERTGGPQAPPSQRNPFRVQSQRGVQSQRVRRAAPRGAEDATVVARASF